MYGYIHRSQDDFLLNEKNYESNEDVNVIHFVYSEISKQYLSDIQQEYQPFINVLNLNIDSDRLDSYLVVDSNMYVYTIKKYDNNYRLVSVIKNDYRNEVKQTLFSSVISITIYVSVGVIFMIMVWVVSLIRPLNYVRNYINKIKNGEDARLYVQRHDEIGEVAEALVGMHKELKQQQRIREEMVQNISHDLKTPIATIKSYSESIKDGVYPYDTLEKSVDVIIEHANRLEKKVYSLITFNKLGYINDNQSDEYNLELAPIVRKAILSCEVLRNDIEIETSIDEDALFHGEEEPWRVVIENLLDNALRYATSKVEIVVEKDKVEIFNDGPLMEKDRIEKLFRPYEKGTGGKFGLGLSIVKKVTETYGYNVVGENMDDGVIFKIYAVRKFKKPKKEKKK